MSRSNPAKLKKRQAKKTLLIVGEGLGEEMVLRYLRSLYGKDTGVSVKIIKGKGGSAHSIVSDANRIIGAFDKRVVVLDNDKSVEEMNEARKFSKTKKIQLIENTPCLEYLLLSILESGVPTTQPSGWYKTLSSQNISTRKNEATRQNMPSIFPRACLILSGQSCPS